MIKKFRMIPLKVLILAALLRRLYPNHPSRNKMEEELRFRRAGTTENCHWIIIWRNCHRSEIASFTTFASPFRKALFSKSILSFYQGVISPFMMQNITLAP